MATEVVIPNLGYTMTVAKILGWKKSVGDPIEFDEPLLEIETDKVNYLIEAPEGGIVKALLANVGDEVPVGGIVAIIAAANEPSHRISPRGAKRPCRIGRSVGVQKPR